MNNLSSSKLNNMMKKQVGWNFRDLDKLSGNEVSKLIESVNEKIGQVKKSKKLYESQKDSKYNGLLLAKRVLETKLHENFQARNNKRSTRLNENDLTQAESIMAARDLVDSLQSMLEEVGEMINEKIPPLVDSLRASYSDNEAQQFSTESNEALSALLDSVRNARENLDKAVRRVSGESVGDDMSSSDDVTDISDLDDLEDEFAASDPAIGGDEEPLGRPERD